MAKFNITLDRPTNKPFNSNDLKPVFAAMESPAEVTSIPSPFAAMHLHNLAFFAANAQRVQTPNLYSVGTGKELYDKIISHTIDIYELLYNWEKLNLEQKGFSIELFSIPTEQEINNIQNLHQEAKEKHKNFRKTLNLYIDLYKTKLNITDDAFDCGYYLKYNGRIIASTSPLTGFFVSASANFGLNGIQGIIPTDTNIVYFSDAPQTFRQLSNRDLEFRKFMCELILNYSPLSFTAFKDYIVEYHREFSETSNYNDVTIDLNKFGFHATQTQRQLLMGAIITPDNNTRVMKSNNNNFIAIPDRYNNVYFRSLINIKNNIHFNLNPEDYVAVITQRRLLKETTSWLSVNDFFQDNIVELQDAINTERFYCCKVIDSNGNNRDVKVLLPLKDRYFEFFNYDDATFHNLLETRLSIKQVTADEYLATLLIPTATGNVNLQKKYSVAENSIVRPKDPVHLGIYPLVKDEDHNNNFFRIFTYHSADVCSKLSFFKDKSSGLNEISDKKIIKESFKQDNKLFPISTYYALESCFIDQNNEIKDNGPVDFDVIKIALKQDKIIYQAFIIPKFIHKKCIGDKGIISIDFGTSNTNISICKDCCSNDILCYDSYILDEESKNISQICTLHKNPNLGINELHFLSEFMPKEISRLNQHKFSAPTIINKRKNSTGNRNTSLIHSNIPFDYYLNGLRNLKTEVNGQTKIVNIDNPRANFKWTQGNNDNKTDVQLFLDQLLFMSRNYLLSNGINPQQTKIIYTTPLSMKKEERTFYETIWNALTTKYFSSVPSNISESRAPYFASKSAFGNNSAILLDIGGGSTDILFFIKENQEKVKGVTSYAFAANALFAGNKENNIFIKHLREKTFDNLSVENDTNMEAADILNYRFAVEPTVVKQTFVENRSWQYLLLLHCSAILYHAIQNNKVIVNDDNKKLRYILFSGNGSKLFKILDSLSDGLTLSNFATAIASYVYKVENIHPSIEIKFVDNDWRKTSEDIESSGMKGATSIGSIFAEIDGEISNNEPIKIPIGDEDTIIDRTKAINWDNDESHKKIIEGVTKNFNGFLDGFLGTTEKNPLFGLGFGNYLEEIPISSDDIRNIINQKDIVKTSINQSLSEYSKPDHSYFFVPLYYKGKNKGTYFGLIKELSEYFANPPKKINI